MSNERKIQTRTIVTIQLEVHDTQPYDDTWTAGSIHRRATENAMNTIAFLNRPELRVVGQPTVKMVITEVGNG